MQSDIDRDCWLLMVSVEWMLLDLAQVAVLKSR